MEFRAYFIRKEERVAHYFLLPYFSFLLPLTPPNFIVSIEDLITICTPSAIS